MYVLTVACAPKRALTDVVSYPPSPGPPLISVSFGSSNSSMQTLLVGCVLRLFEIEKLKLRAVIIQIPLVESKSPVYCVLLM